MRKIQSRMPVAFFGHGNPLNALLNNAYTKGWAAVGAKVPRPRAVLSISAHWYIRGTAVTSIPAPRTLHDFGGFPPELYKVSYPVRGDSGLAARIQSLLAPISVTLDEQSGLDHGTWAVLRHVFPQADIPVVQLSIDKSKPPPFHYQLGRHLAPLREEGVLIMGSGNLVHNLHAYAWGRRAVEPYDWAVRFEKKVRKLLAGGEEDPLVDYERGGADALLSVPTPDHYLPLLYVIALRREGERISFPVEGMDGGSVSMLAVQIG